MVKKLLFVLAACLMSLQMAFAAVDLNQADVAALAEIKGIGPVLSEQIVAERQRGGDYKNWDDLEARVKGIANKKAVQLSNEGVTVDGKKRRGKYKKSEAQAKKEAAAK